MDDTYEEDDVFFGPISKKEGGKIEKIGNRRTIYLGQATINNGEEEVAEDIVSTDGNLHLDLETNLSKEEYDGHAEDIVSTDDDNLHLDLETDLNKEEYDRHAEDIVSTADDNLHLDLETDLNKEEYEGQIVKDSQIEESINSHDLEICNIEQHNVLNINDDSTHDICNSSVHGLLEYENSALNEENVNKEFMDDDLTHSICNSSMQGLEYENSDLNEENVSNENLPSCSSSSEKLNKSECAADVASENKELLKEENVNKEDMNDDSMHVTCNSSMHGLEYENSDLNEKNVNKEVMNDDLMHSIFNSSMQGLEYENSDLNEENVSNENNLQTCSSSSENLNKTECEADDASENKELLEEETDQISNITFQMKKALSMEKNLELNVNNLNKCDINTLKRESYFTSLKLINVLDETYSTDSLNESVNSESASFKVPSEDITEAHEQSSSMSSDIKACSLEVNSSDDKPNNGLLLSRSLSPESFNQNTTDYENLSEDSDHIKEMNLDSEDKHVYIPEVTNSPDSHSSCPSSPEPRFNDTIEEMELLLARGMDYFKDGVVQDDSIVEHPKEQTISSSNSITSFNPNFGSTHASSGDTSKTKVQDIQDECFNPPEENIPLFQSSELKKIPPEKPPRIIVSKVSSDPHPSQSHINIYKHESPSGCSGNSNFAGSPIVKSVTKYKAENFAENRPVAAARSCQGNKPYSLKGISPTTAPRSNLKNQYCLSTPTSSRQFVQKMTFNTPTSFNNLSAAKSKIPRLTPPKPNPIFHTPQHVLPNRIRPTVSKSAQPLRHRKLNIISPVMKYLQDNPPPPLITTVKPRYKLSPSSSVGRNVGDKIDSNSGKMDQILQKANTVKMISFKSPLKEMNTSLDKLENCNSVTSVLPSSVYMQGDSVKLNKENVNNKRTVPSDRPPIYILKHTGRVQVPKAVESSPLEKFDYEAAGQKGTPGRTSLMEVSVYEQRSVRHGNTLK